jgi:hypothetical protein
MFQFEAIPGWYESHWHGDPPRSQRSAFTVSLAGFALLVLLLAGSGMVLSHVHGDGNESGYQDWEEE